METRSTRKFLIKHHPYLQLSNQQHQHTFAGAENSGTMSSNACGEQRPSINFIKMKKLKKKAAAAAAAAAAHRQDGSGSGNGRAATRSSRVNSNR